MEYHQDWFMRQIQMMVSFLIRLLGDPEGDEEIVLQAKIKDNEPHEKLQSLLLQNRICEGEDLLYELADGVNMDAFYAGLRFYWSISQLSEDQLQSCNFSREEIVEGLQALCRRYGISEELLSMM